MHLTFKYSEFFQKLSRHLRPISIFLSFPCSSHSSDGHLHQPDCIICECTTCPSHASDQKGSYTSQAASSVSTRPARLIPLMGTYTLHIPSSYKPTISQHPDFPASAYRNVLTIPITVPLHTYFSYASCSCFFTHASAVPSLQAYSGCLFLPKTNNKQTMNAIQEYVSYRLSDTIICL